MADVDDIKVKLVEPQDDEDVQLPELPQWEQVIGRPTSLADLDPTAEALLESDSATILSLGDVAFLDSITTTYIDDNSITTPKILAGAVSASKISVGSLSAINANLGTITAGTITGVLFRTASSGERIEIDTTNVNQMRFYDSTTLYGYIEADKVGTDGYINLLSDDGNGIRINVGIGASGFNSVSMDANGGSFATSGNASNGILGMYANGADKYIAILRSAGVYTLETDMSLVPEVDGTQDLGSSSKWWDDIYGEKLHAEASIELNGVTINNWTDIASGGANTALSNLASVAINADLDPATTLVRDLGSTTKRWDTLYVDIVNLTGGGYIDDARAIYMETGRTTNPSISGEIRYYDGGTKGFRGYVNGFLGQFDLSAP